MINIVIIIIYTNLEGKRAPKKRNFFVNIFQKVPKNASLDLFFEKICLQCRQFGQNGVFIVILESSENQFGRPKKNRQNFHFF